MWLAALSLSAKVKSHQVSLIANIQDSITGTLMILYIGFAVLTGHQEKNATNRYQIK